MADSPFSFIQDTPAVSRGVFVLVLPTRALRGRSSCL